MEIFSKFLNKTVLGCDTLSHPEREKPGSKVAIRKFMSNPEIFVSYDRKIIISLCTVKNFQAHAENYKQFKKMCHLITKIKLSLFKIKEKF